MNLFDIIIFAISGLSILTGLYKGFIGLSVGLIAFICSITSAYFLEPIVKIVILEYIKSDLAAGLIAGITSFILCTIFFSIASGQIRAMLKEISGGMIDRLCGLFAGALRALIISLGILSLIVIFVNDAYINVANLKEMSDKIDPEKFPKWVTESKSYPILTSAANFIAKHVSKEQLEKIKLPTQTKPTLPNELKPEVNIIIDKEQAIKMSIDLPKNDTKEKTLEEELEDLDK